MKKKLMCIALSSTLTFSSFGMVYADENTNNNTVIEEQETTPINAEIGGGTVSNKEASVTQTGKCGTNVKYTLYSDGVLTISGSGKMLDYDGYKIRSPFYGNEAIKKVIIEDGVTSIGEYAFETEQFVK